MFVEVSGPCPEVEPTGPKSFFGSPPTDELIVDGSFNQASGIWTLGGSTTIDAALHYLHPVGAAQIAGQQITLVNGQQYSFDFDLTFGSGSKIRINLSNTNGANVVWTSGVLSGVSHQSGTFTSNVSGLTWLWLEADSATLDAIIDNVSVRPIAAGGTTYNDNLSADLTGADALDPAGSTFSVPLAEAATLADSQTSAATFPNALSEGLTGADSLTGGLLLAASLNEALTGADSASAAMTFGPSLSEGLTGADSLATAAVFGSSVSEGLTASDVDAPAFSMVASRAEALTAADSLASIGTFPNALSEGLTAATSFSTGLALTESLSAGDSFAVSLIIGGVLSEAITAAAAQVGAASVPVTVAEGLSASDQAQQSAVLNNAVSETLAANDNLDGFVGEPPLPPPSRTIIVGKGRSNVPVSAGGRTVKARGARWNA